MSKINREKFEAWMTAEQAFHGSDFEWDDRRNCYSQFGIHLAYKAFQASLRESEAKLTALTTQLESVVAENAELKLNLQGTAEFCYSDLPETPVTDAILAEVRASGVDDFCNLLGSYAKVEPERFNPQFADLYSKIVNRIFSEVMDNPEVYDLATMSDWLERESENSRAYADMSIRHHDQIRQGGAV